jgi:mannose/fructose/N-acetylgalactosamine-specific phosphotransferase system component IIC
MSPAIDGATFAALVVLGAVLSLDRTAFFQSMASRPLVGATAAGYLLGEPLLGLGSGLLLELLWLMELPVGGWIPPDESVSGVLAGVFAVAAPEAWGPEARTACGVLLAVPAGLACRWLDRVVRRWNGGLLGQVLRDLEAGRPPPLARAQWTGVLRFLAAGAAATALGTAAGTWLLTTWAASLPPETASALSLVQTLLPPLGAGAVLAGLGLRRHGVVFAAGLAGGLGLGHGAEVGVGPGGRPWPS